RTGGSVQHVPCKFFQKGTCAAGAKCPFSHTASPATPSLCNYYAKGNCKFGNKCALLHVLPGDPATFQRAARLSNNAPRSASSAHPLPHRRTNSHVQLPVHALHPKPTLAGFDSNRDMVLSPGSAYPPPQTTTPLVHSPTHSAGRNHPGPLPTHFASTMRDGPLTPTARHLSSSLPIKHSLLDVHGSTSDDALMNRSLTAHLPHPSGQPSPMHRPLMTVHETTQSEHLGVPIGHGFSTALGSLQETRASADDADDLRLPLSLEELLTSKELATSRQARESTSLTTTVAMASHGSAFKLGPVPQPHLSPNSPLRHANIPSLGAIGLGSGPTGLTKSLSSQPSDSLFSPSIWSPVATHSPLARSFFPESPAVRSPSESSHPRGPSFSLDPTAPESPQMYPEAASRPVSLSRLYSASMGSNSVMNAPRPSGLPTPATPTVQHGGGGPSSAHGAFPRDEAFGSAENAATGHRSHSSRLFANSFTQGAGGGYDTSADDGFPFLMDEELHQMSQQMSSLGLDAAGARSTQSAASMAPQQAMPPPPLSAMGKSLFSSPQMSPPFDQATFPRSAAAFNTYTVPR
ncbi:hypothetical protein H4R35_005487, partial [Dimargaris xerosporica]